jgi:hypothetical protein
MLSRVLNVTSAKSNVGVMIHLSVVHSTARSILSSTSQHLDDVWGDAIDDLLFMFFAKKFKRLESCLKLRPLRATAWLICRPRFVYPLCCFTPRGRPRRPPLGAGAG